MAAKTVAFRINPKNREDRGDYGLVGRGGNSTADL